ncbi:MAG TPA: hypothetical protein VHL58_17305 [Thermoanaerobaculia bacterium]|nr:hypothetical protein [Thermoanaerobaculia bacterium]
MKIIAFAAVAAAVGHTSSAQVGIYTWQESLPSRTIYHYRVENTVPEAVHGIEIGTDWDNGGDPQLRIDPIGFDEDIDETLIPADIHGWGFPIPGNSLSTPSGWVGALQVAESDVKRSLYYFVSDPTYSVKGGETLRGFSIAVPTPDDAYRRGKWVAFLERGISITGTLQLDETDAPVPQAALTGGATVCSGGSATLNIALTGNSPWKVTLSEGQATSFTSRVTYFTTSPAQISVAPATSTTYWISGVEDVNRPGTVSGTATITVLATAAIRSQPLSSTAKKASTTTLSVTADGATPLRYQWYQGVSGNTAIAVGTNSSSYTTSKLMQTTSYWVRVSNGCATVASATATVTIK